MIKLLKIITFSFFIVASSCSKGSSSIEFEQCQFKIPEGFVATHNINGNAKYVKHNNGKSKIISLLGNDVNFLEKLQRPEFTIDDSFNHNNIDFVVFKLNLEKLNISIQNVLLKGSEKQLMFLYLNSKETRNFLEDCISPDSIDRIVQSY